MQDDNQEKGGGLRREKRFYPNKEVEIWAKSTPVIFRFPGVSDPLAALYTKF